MHPTFTPGVSNYVYKSRLQEYAQTVGLATPLYETIKEGPSHKPLFRSTVMIGGVRYESLLGFSNRKSAEHSAAEVALLELAKSLDRKDSNALPECILKLFPYFGNMKKSHQDLVDISMHKFQLQTHPESSCDPTTVVRSVTPGVTNSFVFKSRLQEYAHKVRVAAPVYETIREGPSHAPSFRSVVNIAGGKFESLPGFCKRKSAEQSAAEVALYELSKSEVIDWMLPETGLCKNMLQEYAQKMNYAIPTYICREFDTPCRTPLFSCTVEIGARQYIGGAASAKKEAEIKAARTALLAIQSSGRIGGEPQYTVVPFKRNVTAVAPLQADNVKGKKQTQ